MRVVERDYRAVAREGENDQHDLDQRAVGFHARSETLKLVDVIGAVDLVASDEMRFVFEEFRFASSEHGIERSCAAQVVLNEDATNVRRESLIVRRTFEKGLNRSVERADQLERVGLLRAKLQRERRLLFERVLGAKDEILFVVGVDDVREKIPLIHRESRPVVVRDGECRGLNIETMGCLPALCSLSSDLCRGQLPLSSGRVLRGVRNRTNECRVHTKREAFLQAAR